MRIDKYSDRLHVLQIAAILIVGVSVCPARADEDVAADAATSLDETSAEVKRADELIAKVESFQLRAYTAKDAEPYQNAVKELVNLGPSARRRAFERFDDLKVRAGRQWFTFQLSQFYAKHPLEKDVGPAGVRALPALLNELSATSFRGPQPLIGQLLEQYPETLEPTILKLWSSRIPPDEMAEILKPAGNVRIIEAFWSRVEKTIAGSYDASDTLAVVAYLGPDGQGLLREIADGSAPRLRALQAEEMQSQKGFERGRRVMALREAAVRFLVRPPLHRQGAKPFVPGTDAVQAVVARLTDPDAGLRRTAGQALSEMGDDGLSILIGRFSKSTDAAELQELNRFIGNRLPIPHSLSSDPELARDDAFRAAGATVMRLLLDHRKEAARKLVEMLEDPDPQLRRVASLTLLERQRELGDLPKDLPDRMLASTHPEVRAAVAKVMTKNGAHDYKQLDPSKLVPMLSSAEPDARALASAQLFGSGARTLPDPALVLGAKDSQYPDVRKAAIESLSRHSEFAVNIGLDTARQIDKSNHWERMTQHPAFFPRSSGWATPTSTPTAAGAAAPVSLKSVSNVVLAPIQVAAFWLTAIAGLLWLIALPLFLFVKPIRKGSSPPVAPDFPE